MKKLKLLILISTFANTSLKAKNNYDYPVTEKQSIGDEYFERKVEDPYRWL